jgi:hypothetical protein
MLCLLPLMLAAAIPDPTPEALALGKRLAETGTLAALLPVIAAKETEDLVGEHPEYSDADKAALRDVAREQGGLSAARLTDAIGRGYAEKLSIDDLRALVAFNASPAARHWREATPGAVIAAMGAVGELDFKADARKAFCAKTGKGCPAR